MASKSREYCTQSVSFRKVEDHIHSFFDVLLGRVEERRNCLLSQLYNMELEYLKKEDTRKKQVEELEKMYRETGNISIRENPIMTVKQHHLHHISVEMEKFQQSTSIPFPVFRTEDLKHHLEQLGRIGEIESSSIYRTKRIPARNIGNKELDRPYGICLDQDETIYVCDSGNRRIQIFSKEGEFLSELGKGQLDRPHSIAVTDEWVFVVDWGINAVSKFQKSDHILLNRSVEIGFLKPKALALDRNNDVFVADCGNHRIAVLNSDLEFKREIGKEKLKHPCGVQMSMNKIFVVDYSKHHNVHVFSLRGELLNSMIDLKLENSTAPKNSVRHSVFLCFDKFGNIIISATEDKSIQIYTVEGNFLHSIKCEGSPTGIAVTDDDTIVCAMYEPSYIKFY